MTGRSRETRRARALLAAGAVLLAAGGFAVWRYSPLGDVLTPERLGAFLARFAQAPWAPAAVVGLYVAAGFVVFPLLVLIGATAVVFDPATALLVSLLGSLANAIALYLAGASLARATVRQALGDALGRVLDALRDRGVVAVALLRSVPVAPFTVVNLAAGSIGIPLREYVLGTALGLAPGIVLMTALGNRLRSLWQEPTAGNIAILAAIVAAWIGTVLVLQRLATRVRGRREAATSNS